MKKNLPLILSIVGLVLSLFVIGIPFSIAGIITGALKKGAGKNLNTVAIVIGVIGLLIGAIMLTPTEKKDEPQTTEVVEEIKEEPKEVVEEKKEEPKEVKEEPKEDNKDYYSIGDTADYKGFQLTLISYTESEGGDWGEPQDGNIFVYPEFEAYNGTDDEVIISTMAGSFEVYCDDYKMDTSSNAMMYASTEKMGDIGGSIAPGKKNKGVYNMLEVPKDWKKIEILYYDNMFKDATFTFIIEK